MRNYRLRIAGPSGQIETVINDPAAVRRGIALIAHPHPLHGGSLDSKVTATIAKTLAANGYVCVRPNFRGVGNSAGEYAHGDGEAEDMRAVWQFVSAKFSSAPLLLAGFSFGAYVQAKVAPQLPAQRMILVAPAINLFGFDTLAAPAAVIHGEQDELVPLAAVKTWTDAHVIPLEVVAGAGHYFHRHLSRLTRAVSQVCQS